jgi:proteasome lid subunit RPN8/RPN11
VHRWRNGYRDGCGGPIVVRFPQAVIEEIVAHAREAAPRECCGLLVGSGFDIREAVRTRNLADSPNRFVLDPKDHIDARRDARTRGLEVIGFYHSHPHSEPEPSESDVAQAMYLDHLYAIVQPLPDAAKLRLFRFENAGFLELAFETR